MYALRIVVKVLVSVVALSLITGSVSEDFAAQLVGLQRYGVCLMIFGSVALLHLFIWQFIVGNSAILGRDSRSFIEFGGSKTFFSGLTTLGYMALAFHCLRIAGFPTRIDPNVFGNADRLVCGLTFGLTLIGIGLAAKLRMLFQRLQSIPE